MDSVFFYTPCSTESEGPIASRRRSRNVGFSAQSREWCDCARTTREINESSSTDGSLSLSNSYLETEFPTFPVRSPVMENRGAHPLPQDLLDLLHEMTERLHAHEERIEGGLPEQAASNLQYFVVLLLMILTNGFKYFKGMPLLMGGPLNNTRVDIQRVSVK